EDGACLAFCRVTSTDGSLWLAGIAPEFAWGPRSVSEFGWHGLRLSDRQTGRRFDGPAVVEVDWTSSPAREPAFDRTTVDYSKKALSALEWLLAEVNGLYREFVFEHQDSTFTTLNAAITDQPLPKKAPLMWLTHSEGANAEWRPVSFPAAATDRKNA